MQMHRACMKYWTMDMSRIIRLSRAGGDAAQFQTNDHKNAYANAFIQGSDSH